MTQGEAPAIYTSPVPGTGYFLLNSGRDGEGPAACQRLCTVADMGPTLRVLGPCLAARGLGVCRAA